MQYKLTAFCVFILGMLFCKAQAPEKANAVSFELGKTGLLYNITFDHKAATTDFGFRLVAGSNFARYLNAVSVGGGGYRLFGKANRFFEAGLDVQYLVVNEVSDDQKGFAFVYPNFSIKTIYPSLNFGYRAYGERTVFRVGVSPGVIDSRLIPGGYLSYGLRL